MTQTWWLENGHWRASGGSSGEYWVDGDEHLDPVDRAVRGRLHLHRFTRDDDGNLTLVPAEPMDPADAFLMSGKPWIKIG